MKRANSSRIKRANAKNSQYILGVFVFRKENHYPHITVCSILETQLTHQVRRNMTEIIGSDSINIVSQVLVAMKREQGDSFSYQKVNLAELQRRTGISRKTLRNLQKNGFREKSHGNKGKKRNKTVLTGFTGMVDDLLRKGVHNSAVAYERIKEVGYPGGLTQLKEYMRQHKDLLPAKRQIVSSQGNRGRRYSTGPGEAYQMDWGFVNVEYDAHVEAQVSCFAMICHHCGERYIEFFTNARQENLFIGMIHAFSYMGIPQRILTDNMKSVVVRRNEDGKPVWQKDYAEFMNTIGFETTLCKPRHPFTKGAVERLVRFVKDNFIVGRTFHDLSDLNSQAIEWCNKQNSIYHKAVNCIPQEKHAEYCWCVARELARTVEIAKYLCPIRLISFDGFVNYEGRRFGVPYWYEEHSCRVKRDQGSLYIYNMELTKVLATHPVTWSRDDCFCKDQYQEKQPEELPSVPVKSVIQRAEPPKRLTGFAKFNFDLEDIDDE